MRIATYNVEWFSNLFDRHGQFMADDAASGRFNVTCGEQVAALGRVFCALDADAVLVVEAPEMNKRRNTVTMLERFAARFGLRTHRAMMGFVNHTQQEIALLYDPEVVSAEHDPMGSDFGPDRFDGSFLIDLNTDGNPDTVTFTKPPLEAALTLKSGPQLRLIGVHIKSKAPRGGISPEAEIRLAIENRRKQLAQCIWLRGRVAAHLMAGDSLVVLGDFNDGPGLDEYEKLFGRSGIEIVLGEEALPALRLADPHAAPACGHPTLATPASARFYLDEEGQFFSAMLDFVMLSPDLCARGPKWRIWHPFDDPACYADADLREALLTASDHFPVSVDISF